jgi:N-acetylglucosamine-6-phosphate deacetylase
MPPIARASRHPRRRFLATTLGLAAASRYEGLRAPLAAARDQAQPAPTRSIRRNGFFDLQVNGFSGVDFNDPVTTAEHVEHAIAELRKTGVTRFLPTLISAPLEDFQRCARTIAGVRSPAIAGVHMEGPYISPQEGARGAHPREFIIPASRDDFERRREATGRAVRLVTIAPEVPGAIELIEHLRKEGIFVAIGHTSASPTEIADGIKAGATLSTHLGNGCPQMLPRHPNVIWEQLAADELTAGLIVDGHHLPPSTVKAMVRAKGAGRTVLVTDATAAAGRPPGDYRLGALTVHVDATGRVAVPGQPNLAGSALSLDRAVANVVRFAGIALDEALQMASERPAAAVGLTPAETIDIEWDGETVRISAAH